MKCIYCNEQLRVIEALEGDSCAEDEDYLDLKEERIYNVIGWCSACEKEFKYKLKRKTIILDSEYDLKETVY